MANKKRILILVADAGFGHRSAANAIAAALRELHPEDCSIEIVNPLQDKRVPALLRRSAGPDYDRMVRQMPLLFKLNYDVSDLGPTSAMVQGAMAALLFDAIGSIIQRSQPDAIVSPYPLYQAPLAVVCALKQVDIPLLTVVTDLAPVHRTWFSKSADLCLVSMDAVRDQALEHGLSPEKVVVTGIPVHPKLAKKDREPAAVRAEMGWSPGLVTMLAVGSKRVRRLSGILHALNHSGLPLQLVLIAGGDEALYHQFQETEWHVPAHIYNFVEDMPTFMHAADCIICKAGGLIVTESLACGLPILLTDFIEGQETSNANYVVNGSAGDLALTPIEGLETVYHWLANGGELLAQRAQNACRLGRPQAAYDVARLAWEAALRGPQTKAEPSLSEKIERLVKEGVLPERIERLLKETVSQYIKPGM